MRSSNEQLAKRIESEVTLRDVHQTRNKGSSQGGVQNQMARVTQGNVRRPRGAPVSKANVNKPMEAVRGSRRIWGAHRSATTEAVKTVLKSTNVATVEDLSIRRKYKLAQVSGVKHEVRWWFVVKGEENVLKQLDERWKQPQATMIPPRWKLEPLMRYRIDHAPLPAVDQISCNDSELHAIGK